MNFKMDLPIISSKEPNNEKKEIIINNTENIEIFELWKLPSFIYSLIGEKYEFIYNLHIIKIKIEKNHYIL